MLRAQAETEAEEGRLVRLLTIPARSSAAGELGNLLATFMSSPLRASPSSRIDSGDGYCLKLSWKGDPAYTGPRSRNGAPFRIASIQAGEYLPLAASHFSLVMAEKP